ncbi:FG-GAP repeat domain-containing protein [Catellatospora tritici]|uniref:FG-GAP repeat domain-containing protein n=1 Tax=Catellatospora tritici TaxID=2851566 RepID=UPI001C2DE928|nr:VCBS repeat-containing protein [Catellatospora tritici]MBV1850501.1 VCBS repeat-containing protein [Catellatospora tritici]
MLPALVATTTAANPLPVSAAPTASCAGVSAVAADERTAVASARACHVRVEVTGKRTEQAETYANPDGTYTMRISAVPQRVKQSDGTWAAIDTRLRRRADGALVPAMVAQPLALSGGGTAPLVSLRTKGGDLTLSWPAPLPTPTIDGDAAVYAAVRPGVDLRVRALRTGFTYVLVARDAAALRQLTRVALTVGGPTLQKRGDGSAEVVSRAGEVLLSAGGATMWDSTGTGSSAAGPGDTARNAAVRTTVAGNQLVLEPDAAALDDPALTFPVYVDPQIAGRNRWAYADSSNSDRNDGIARVGQNPDGSGTYRSFFEFPMAGTAGARIIATSFDTLLTHSYSCGGTPVSLYWTSAITAGVNGTRVGWSPALNQWLDEQWGMAHKPSGGTGCANDPQPDLPMHFNNVLQTKVQEWANAGVSAVTLGLSAKGPNGLNETATDRWKKFDPGSTWLVINYNSYPVTPAPSALTTVGTSQTVACHTGDVAQQPHIGTTNGVHLRATLTDNDSADVLVARYEWQDVTTGLSHIMADTPGFNPPHTFDVTVPAASLPAGHSIRWRVHAFDGTDSGGTSAWCQFAVDNGVPGQPTLTSTDLPVFPANPPTTATIGRPGTVTATPAPGDTDIVAYYYGIGAAEQAPTTYIQAAADGTAQLPIVPVVSGLNKNFLTVVAVDAAGNRSPLPVSAPDGGGTRQFRANAPATVTHVKGDVTGDGKADITGYYDLGNGQSQFMTFVSKADGSGYYQPVTPIVHDAGALPAGSTRVNGDFTGDGVTDLAAFRDEGNCRMTLYWWTGTRNGFSASSGPLWDSGAGNWCFANVGNKVFTGDYTGDGKDDIGLFYKYPNQLTRLFVFPAKADGTGFGLPQIWWDSGVGNFDWNRMRAVSGNFDGNGKAGVAVIYDYGNCVTSVFRYTSTGTAMNWPTLVFHTEPPDWCSPNMTAWFGGDLTGDGKDDISALYYYGNNFYKLFSFAGPGLGPIGETGVPATQGDANQLKSFVGDANGDGRADFGSFVNTDAATNRTQLRVFYGNGSTFATDVLRWDSNTLTGGLNWSRFTPIV